MPTDPLTQAQLDLIANASVHVNPNANWIDVDVVLRNAVGKAAYDLGCVLQVSSGKHRGPASRSFHAVGRAVDISRVHGRSFTEMPLAERYVTTRALGIYIMWGIPAGRRAEFFSPTVLGRFDRKLGLARLGNVQPHRRNHVHVLIR
jgi:hypothetical protein